MVWLRLWAFFSPILCPPYLNAIWNKQLSEIPLWYGSTIRKWLSRRVENISSTRLGGLWKQRQRQGGEAARQARSEGAR
jgi:hypothetical protein